MGVIGFSFSKIDCRREQASLKDGIEIKHNISVKNLEKTTLEISGNKNEVLKVYFAFDVLYSAGLGKVSIEGDLVYTDTKEIIAETMKEWESSKKLNTTVGQTVFKFIYNKTIIKVLQMADSVGLPSPIPLQKIKFASEDKEE